MLPARTLTFQFDRVVSSDGVTPEEWEVRLQPLGDRLTGTVPDATLVGGGATQFVVLSEATNTVSFQVVPSDSPGLQGQTLWYRVGWRNRWFGKLTVTDFTMPDADLTFKQLTDLGAVIGSDVYVRQVDIGVHVAGLDDDGNVLDGHGNIVGIDTSGITAQISAERLARQNAINSLQTLLQNDIAAQVEQTLSTATVRINAAVSVLETADLTERGQRIAAVNDLNAAMATVQTTLTNQLGDIAAQVAAHTAALPTKADLVNGVVPTSQIPALSLTTAVPVISQAAMLALTTDQVQPGDLAVRPDGSYMLLQNPPSTLANWIKISTGGNVTSVNGQVGPVVLGAADVGAIAIGAMIDQSQITNLVSALAAKASVSSVNGIDTRLSTVENDATIVRTTAGLIAKALMPADTVFVNGSNQLVKKNGDIISLGGGGGPVDWGNLVNLPATFPPTIGATADTAVAGNDTRLTDSRTPTAHASTHAAAGSDPVTITTAQVTGLPATLTNYGNRINTLESGTSDPGGGGGPPVKAAWFDGVAVTDIEDPAEFQAEMVLQKSPFGEAVDGTYYYNPVGADNDEWLFPYITPNGHLKLVRWDENQPPDPVLATAASVTELTDDVALKADAADLTALAGTVGTKADKTYVDNADASLQSALTTGLAGKAAQSDYLALQTAVAGKALQADLTALTTVVNGKAATIDVNALTTRVTTAEGQIANKADVVGGRVPNNQLRDDIPASKISGLPAQLTGKADLDGGTGKLLLTQTPQNIPIEYVANLPTTLAGKADLVAGKLATSQLPALSINDIFPVANRAGMLALTTAQVQTGDIALITGTADKGSYFYTGSDPSLFSSWTKAPAPDDLVSSVNGQIGPVVLAAADVNARSATDPIGSGDLSGALSSTIAGKADTSTVNAALATKPSITDVQALMSQAASPQPVDLVATTNITLANTPSIDGQLTTIGQRVLATAQSSSINNGVYIVSAGTWSRAADMNGPTPANPGIAATYFLRGTVLIASQGTTHANTVWMQTATSGQVGVSPNNWTKALTAGPPLIYTAANNSGLVITGTAVVVKNTTGISVTTAGVGVDHTRVPWVYRGDVPGGSGLTSVTITHNLGVQAVASVVLYDKVSNVASYIGWTNATANSITLDFQVPPNSGQYAVVITA